MLVPVQRLVRRIRLPRSRVAELVDVERRLRDEAAGSATAEERAAAAELLRLRAALAEQLGQVVACGGCTRGRPWPEGAFAGGHCCSGRTEDVFTDDEVAALALGGTRRRQLRAPDGEHAGCAFRGPTGCSLAAADRPTVCARYLCTDLRRELHGHGRLAAIEARVGELEETFARFVALRAARRRRDWLAAIDPRLAD